MIRAACYIQLVDVRTWFHPTSWPCDEDGTRPDGKYAVGDVYFAELCILRQARRPRARPTLTYVLAPRERITTHPAPTARPQRAAATAAYHVRPSHAPTPRPTMSRPCSTSDTTVHSRTRPLAAPHHMLLLTDLL